MTFASPDSLVRTTLLAVLCAACVSDTPMQSPEPVIPATLQISDGGNGGVPDGFIWLTPAVKGGLKTFDDPFDPDLTPIIDICRITSDALPGPAACTGAVLRTLSGTSQPEIIRVDLPAENYSVTWQSTAGNGISAGNKYRAVVRVGTRVLGWADLAAVEKQKETAKVAPGYVGFVVGSPFLFKWRIETGIPGAVVVTPTPVTIKDNQTQVFTAVVTDLHGVLLPDVTVNWSIANTGIATLSPASGVSDAAGAVTTTATPVLGVGGVTTVSANSEGAIGTASLTVKRAVGSVTVTPTDPSILDNASQLFTATVLDLIGNPLADAAVTWTFDTPAIATLSPTSGTSNASGVTTTTATATGTTGMGTITASADGKSGSTTLTITPSCTLASTDTDGDRLPDCYESNTKVFNGLTDTGTDPNDADTDNDNLSDGDEVRGTALGLDLPAMGTNPLRRDILLEYDWFDDNNDAGICTAHSHRPSAAAITRLNTAFSSASTVTNPDGSTGVNVINDYGQGGAFTGGTVVADADGVIAGGVDDAQFQAFKGANFAANRNGYFHYVLLPHNYDTNSGSSGQAEIDGDDLIVSLQCYLSTENVANTIMHELGHNLNLRHGGDENLNYKPNYNSVMNYIYQFPGINNNCTLPGAGVLSYSVGVRINLNENSLSEPNGVCNGPAIDWNGDGDATDTGLSRNLNPQYDNVLGILHDFNDWAAVKLAGVGEADGSTNLLMNGVSSLRTKQQRTRKIKEIVTCSDTPRRMRR